MIPKKLYVRELDIDIFDQEVNLTRAWVANKPCTGRREYTDLSQVWHNASIEPERGAFFIAEDNKGGLDAYCWTQRDDDWIEYACSFGLRRWAYMKDLLPKGGEQ